MHLISIDSLLLDLGVLAFAYAGIEIGIALGALIVAVMTPTLDGERDYRIAYMQVACSKMTGLKVIFTLVATLIAVVVFGSTGAAVLCSMLETGLIGIGVMLVYGFSL